LNSGRIVLFTRPEMHGGGPRGKHKFYFHQSTGTRPPRLLFPHPRGPRPSLSPGGALRESRAPPDPVEWKIVRAPQMVWPRFPQFGAEPKF